MNKQLGEVIRQGYSVVTASSRLASRLRYDYASMMLADRQTVWESADILPWQTWLIRNWETHEFARQSGLMLLNTAQQYYLWQTTIQASTHSSNLLQLKPVIQQALYAYELCKSWDIPIFPEGIYLNQDARVFKAWVDAYERTLKKNSWIDPSSLASRLSLSNLEGDTKIAFYGFDELTPQQRTLLAALAAHGNTVIIIDPDHRNDHAHYQGFADHRDELNAAANWARQILNREADARIGIIVPDLKSLRQQVITVFDQVLHPERLVQNDDHADRHYTITLGRSLAEYPLVQTALQILALGRKKHTLNSLSLLLRSSFIQGANSELIARAQFDAALREAGEYEWQINSLVRYAEHQLKEHDKAPGFLSLLKQSDALYQQSPKMLSPREWAIRFDERLKLWGWPGERELNSVEYQTLDAWKDALSNLASLGGIVNKCNYQTALSHLSKIITDTSFQPESAEAPVQISGLPGAAAMQADYLWVTGLHDQCWPPAVQTNPFIPLQIQREADMPGASAGRELHRTRRLSEQLIASARQIIFSYPMAEGDRACRPSPVLRQYLQSSVPASIECQDDYRSLIYQSAQSEFIADAIAPAVVAGGKTSGGSSVFKDQAACPFRAFARHRLFASSLAEVSIGLDPAVRGQLAHNTMQQIWQQLQSSETLRQMSDFELQKIISAAVASAIRAQAEQQPESFTRRFSELETQRLINLANFSLALERDRPSFIIREIEQWHQVRLGDLEIIMRIDRIDELADGRGIVIDYKTGRVNPADWYGERPADPQLPLYAISAEGEIAAIAYASLKHGDYKFAGLAEADGLLPGVKAAMDKDTGELLWSTRMEEWRMVLSQLARDFLAGKAAVEPKDGNSCRYCDLHTLCRIHELQTMSLIEEYDEQ